jgi:hypothetical protein
MALLRLDRTNSSRNESPSSPLASPRFKVKFAAAERWASRRLGTVAHERRVATIAESLFDLTSRILALGAADGRLLQLAAVVHDVGRSVAKAEHPAKGARMLLSDTRLPLSASERRAVAYLTRYHKGRVPPAGEDSILHRGDPHQRLRRVLALLRSADALDSRSLRPPRLVFALDSGSAARPRLAGADPSRRRPGVLRVTCYLNKDCAESRRVYRRRKKFRLLEELTGLRVEVDIARAEALRMVA